MAGRGLRCPNQPGMSQIPGSDMNSEEVKYPLFMAESLPPNRHQTNGYISTKFYYQTKVGQSVFAHFWLNEAETPSVEGSTGSLLFRGGQPRTLPPFLGWGRGRPWKTPRSGQ